MSWGKLNALYAYWTRGARGAPGREWPAGAPSPGPSCRRRPGNPRHRV